MDWHADCEGPQRIMHEDHTMTRKPAISGESVATEPPPSGVRREKLDGTVSFSDASFAAVAVGPARVIPCMWGLRLHRARRGRRRRGV